MCMGGCSQGCGSCSAVIERLQGWQRGNYGFGAGYDQANRSSFNATILPYVAHPEPGNLGYRIVSRELPIMPLPYIPGYGGDLPLTEQPKIDQPQPFAYRYRG